ncbi:hypothetical protein RUM44_013342 [Polyplax serrata]|uniref:Uncharacterized protein n=1 Tax=Polyplax serrata TaxID=468196 RepID=A0ABR1BHN0_POLSC
MAINHRPHCSAHKKLRKKERGTFWKPNPILNSRLLQAPGMANRRFDGFTGSDIDQLIQNRTGKSLYLKKFIFLQGRTLLQFMRKRKPNENKDRGGQFCVETAQRWRWRRQRERRWCNSSGGTVETSRRRPGAIEKEIQFQFAWRYEKPNVRVGSERYERQTKERVVVEEKRKDR